MSVDYSSRLSAYSNKGVCGIPEKHDDITSVEEKVSLLSEWIKSSGHAVVHTGAGISTSAGIPDFRGPNGVWTLEKEGQTVKTDVTFQDAIPTFTHYALVGLVQSGFVKYVVSQNVDGLHLRSGLPR
jgi:mono-ADP-ribosyltransferase sirtuin 6